MNFAKTLKQLRKENNLTYNELADNIGYSKAIIGFWENEQKQPTLQALIALSNYFNVSIDYLSGREEEDGRIIIKEQELPNDEKNLLNNYRHLPNELKTMTQEYVKTLNNLNNEFYNISDKKNA